MAAVLVESKSTPVPRAPAGENAPPHDYRGGRIYSNRQHKVFRVIRQRGIYKIERKIGWSDDNPSPSEWRLALKLIDDYRPVK